MSREELRIALLLALEKTIGLGRLLNRDTRVLLLSVKGVLAVDWPVTNEFLDECLKTLPKGAWQEPKDETQ